MSNYKLSKVQIESEFLGVCTFDAWVDQENDWNGWAIPMFDEENANKVALALNLRYDKERDCYMESLADLERAGYTAGESEEWHPEFSEEVCEKVYFIGSAYWCWTELKSEHNNMHQALHNFVRYADELSDNWDNEYPTIKDGLYPHYLPSFDEFILDMKNLILSEKDNHDSKALEEWKKTIK